ncbi:MAG: activase [Deltaproteobacteria bacterium]|nr:activase [Deltaproteobacteria bacterium]
MQSIGFDIGSTSVKATLVEDGRIAWHDDLAHEGDIPGALARLLSAHGVSAGILSLCTGNTGRNQVCTARAVPPQAIEAALQAVGIRPDAVVSLGGESIVAYTMGPDGLTRTALTGDKCAAGTGEFLRQQLGRMDMALDDIARIPEGTRPHRLSSRCSVFMKSDCTHKLNKRECTKDEIVVSLADVMAGKAAEFLTRARISSGKAVVIGGVTRNRFLLRLLADRLPDVAFVVPDEAPWFESFGAACLAATHGRPLPPVADLFESREVAFDRYPSLATALPLVDAIPSHRGRPRPGGTYILGIDGGSTTTKAVLVDREDSSIVAEYYGRTHGDPVEALRVVLREVRSQVREAIGDAAIHIPLAATTGSSREVLGVFTETSGVYNEIIAHSVGTTRFRPDIDTIFEIGGQDAKYVYLQNGVPVDYAMNEACSAGTGSFLEESARGDLDIRSASEIGPIALESGAPLKFGEHCSAFINSDIRAAIQQGASRPDIVAGVVFSIVSNYLNRVVGNRRIGERIVIQGGVAKNPAVPAAFAAVLGKEITVPPDPELLGAYGVALLAVQKHAEGLLPEGSFDLDALIARPISQGKVFTCNACENLCPIRTLHVGDHKYFFGGRCNKYANLRNKVPVDVDRVQDWVALRERLLFHEFAPDPTTFEARSPLIVGIPRAFTVHTLWPLYAWFFHELGVRAVLSDEMLREGIQRAEAAFCYPGEIAHGMMARLLADGVDRVFLPSVRTFESLESDVHATTCPITQGLPYYLRSAFQVPDEHILRPVLQFRDGPLGAEPAFQQVARQLGFTADDGHRAYRVAIERQQACWRRLREIGTEALERARTEERVVIGLFGRPYNAFTPEANMQIPRKFTSRGHAVLPFDMLPVGGESISPNMYWYYGQVDLKALRLVKDHPNVFACWISNFGCAPDSFLLHFVRWMMGSKPFLVLELDSHTADAGLDTRIEAFLDIVEGWRRKATGVLLPEPKPTWRVEFAGEDSCVVNDRTGERLSLRHPRVRMVFPSMGDLGAQAIAAIALRTGIRAEHLPPADHQTTQLARGVASGKECIPTLLVLGQILHLLLTRPAFDDEVLAVIVPKTTGPCRTGQYGPFYEGTFAELGVDNVAVTALNSDNGYREFGDDFTRKAWHAVVLSDFFTDIRTSLKILAKDREAALGEFQACWNDLVEVMRTDASVLEPTLEQVAGRLAAIPRTGDADALPKVLVVGEIYVRRDDFSVDELIEHFATNRILGKVTGLAEWMHYCDWILEKDLLRAWRAHPWWRRSPVRLARYAKVRLTTLIMNRIESRARRLLKPTGLLPTYPHDIAEIMAGVDEFSHPDFETEATVSSLVAALAVRRGYHGVAAIAPFACLPGRLIKALLEPWTRERGVPFIALENDGLAYPPNTLARLEIFMLDVLRRAGAEAGKAFVSVELAARQAPPTQAPLAVKRRLRERRESTGAAAR